MSQPLVLRTACTLDCPDTCTLDVHVLDGKLIKVDAAPVGEGNPLTQGYICQKVKHHPQRVYSPDRVLTPLIRIGPKGTGQFRAASWDEALALTARKIDDALNSAGPDAVFPYLYNSSAGVSGAGATVHLFAALGCPDIEHTICANAAGMAYDQVFDGMISADAWDVVHSKLIVVWGANPQVSNTHLLPILADAKKAGATLVVIDPRRTGAAARADLHLAVRPGTDVLLAYAAALRLDERGAFDDAFIAANVRGADEFMAAARRVVSSVEWAIEECGLTEAAFETFVQLLAGPRPAMLRMGWGLERNRNGGSGIVAAYGLWALLGNFGVLGSGVVQSQSGTTKYSTAAAAAAVGPKGSTDRRSISMNQVGAALCGRTPGWTAPQVLVIQGANPAVTSVDQNTMLRGLNGDDVFTVVHDQVLTDTALLADVVFPATTHFEADDHAASYGSFTMQPVPAVIERVGESRTNDEFALGLAAALGRDVGALSAADYLADGDGSSRVTREPGTTVQFVDTFPSGGRLRIAMDPADTELPTPTYRPLERGEGLVLLTPATNRTINSMFAEFDPPDAVITINPTDASRRGIADGATVSISNDLGTLQLPARVDDVVRAGVCHIPKGLWLRHTDGRATANVFAPSFEADLGNGACFNDAVVQVVPVS